MHLKVPLHNLGAGYRLGNAPTAPCPQHAAIFSTFYGFNGVINYVSQFGAAIYLKQIDTEWKLQIKAKL